jgi:hypothetical protein
VFRTLQEHRIPQNHNAQMFGEVYKMHKVNVVYMKLKKKGKIGRH